LNTDLGLPTIFDFSKISWNFQVFPKALPSFQASEACQTYQDLAFQGLRTAAKT